MRIVSAIVLLLVAGYCVAETQPQIKEENPNRLELLLAVEDDCSVSESAEGEDAGATPPSSTLTGCITTLDCTSLECIKRQAEKNWAEACISQKVALYGNTVTDSGTYTAACRMAARRANR